jgi:hypothetical protein
MAKRMTGALATLVVAGLAALFAGCATGINFDGGSDAPDDDDEGSGGEGGGGGGGGGAGGIVDGIPCELDCAAIDTPQCTKGVCDTQTGQCKLAPGPKGEPCDDGLFCTVGEACDEGVCEDGALNTCGLEVGDCTEVVCNEAQGTCSQKPLPDGLFCDAEKDLCTVNTACKAGVCVGVPKDCFFAPMPDACHVGVCNPDTGVCEPTPGNHGKPCPDDGDPCSVQKTCALGVCQGGLPKNCSAASDGCNTGVCDALSGDCYPAPKAVGTACPEAVDECNTGACDAAGTCLPVPTPGVACASATDACNAGTCDAAGACAAAAVNEGGACEDGNACTLGETCSAGVCQGGVAGSYEVYFSETFAGNVAGWTLGPEWAIGPAMASVGFPTGNQDPAEDHTPSMDNGIAGVVIGGYASTALHPHYYLVSPVINTDVAGPVQLEFWRWLNSDYTPFMQNTIDVFDGTAWQNVWATGEFPMVQDAAWTHVTYDLTAYKNANMQIRFGFNVGSSGVYTVSSWNIDDVVVANAVCN